MSETMKPGCYLIYGDEPYLINQKLRSVKESIQSPEFNYTECNQIQENILEALYQLPFMADIKAVVCRVSKINDSEFKIIEKYFKDKCPSTLFIISVENIDKRKKYFKFFNKHKAAFEIKKLSSKKLISYIQSYCNTHGVTISVDIAEYLTTRLGYSQDNKNLYDIVNALDILINTQKDITKNLIDELIEPSIEDNVFKLTGYINKKDSKAFNLLKDLLVNNSPFAIIGLLKRHFRILLKVNILVSENIPLKELKLSPYVLNQYKGLDIGINDAMEILEYLSSIESEIKTGAVDTDLAAELIVARLVS